jgi:hypothetical protein
LNTALISFYIYIPYSVPCCLTSFLSKPLSIAVMHVYTHTIQTKKCSRCEIVGLDDKRENTGEWKYIDKNHAIPINCIQSTKCQISLKWQLPIEKRKINKHVISVLSVLSITTSNSQSIMK